MKQMKRWDRWMLRRLEAFVQWEGRKFLHLQPGYEESFLEIDQQKKPVHSMYLHIPFCRQLCPYCSFNRVAYEPVLVKAYFEALKKEISHYAQAGYAFTHVYLGGGTPTVDVELLLDLLTFTRSQFPIEQISLETNPADLNGATIEGLQKADIQRLSLGVQSFNDTMLKSLGRLSHDGKTAMQNIAKVKGLFDTVNIDLMYNFPSQTMEHFLEDIRIFKSLDIEQVTFYPLMPSPHKKTALERRFSRVDPSREMEFYQVLLDEMLEVYHPSTVWCFSRGERIIDEYIIEYDDYAGLGAGSVGFIDGVFLVNAFKPERYIEQINQDRNAVVYHTRSSRKDHARYQMLTRLFGMKWNWKEHQQLFGKVLWPEVAMLKTAGIVEEKDGTLIPTRKGMYYVSIMMKNFFATLNGLREECISSGV